MRIDGAIFDVDGTLLDSMFVWNNIGEDYLLSRGIKSRENLNKTFEYMSILQSAQYYQSEYGLKDSTDEIVNGINKMIARFYMEEAKLKDGVKEFLESLHKNGIQMCVATATDRHLIEPALKRTGIAQYFSEIFTCTSVGFGKDNPTIYLKALEHLKTKKENTFVFEDALYAIKTAKNIGFNVVGVHDKVEIINQHEIKNLVDLYINSFSEMSEYLDEKSFNNSRIRL